MVLVIMMVSPPQVDDVLLWSFFSLKINIYFQAKSASHIVQMNPGELLLDSSNIWRMIFDKAIESRPSFMPDRFVLKFHKKYRSLRVDNKPTYLR